MAKLTDKFSVLIRSSVRGVLPGGSGRSPKLGKDADRQSEALRAQINAALDDEDRLSAEVAGMEREASDWDRQADQALAGGDEASARQAIRQMQLAQQRVALRQADLDQHRRSTADLISRVNVLEARIAQVHSQDQPAAPLDSRVKETIGARLRTVQQSLEDKGSAADVPDEQPSLADEQAVEDDLARRRSRLSQ